MAFEHFPRQKEGLFDKKRTYETWSDVSFKKFFSKKNSKEKKIEQQLQFRLHT